MKTPNTACTRRVGVAAFSSSLRDWSWFRQNGVVSSRPPAGNADRWALSDKNKEITKHDICEQREKQGQAMQASTPKLEHKISYDLLKLGFLVFLVLSPLLPYGITMAYNSYLLVRTPALIKSLSVFPGATLDKSYIRQDGQTNHCLELIVRYKSKVPYDQEKLRAFYTSALLKQGWHKHPGGFFAKPYFSKSTMIVDISTDQKIIWLRVTFLAFPIFQPGCFQ